MPGPGGVASRIVAVACAPQTVDRNTPQVMAERALDNAALPPCPPGMRPRVGATPLPEALGRKGPI